MLATVSSVPAPGSLSCPELLLTAHCSHPGPGHYMGQVLPGHYMGQVLPGHCLVTVPVTVTAADDDMTTVAYL